MDQLKTDISAFANVELGKGRALIGQAINGLGAFVSQEVTTAVPPEMPKLENDAITVALDVLPATVHTEVQPFLMALAAGTEAKLNPEIVKRLSGLVQTGILRLKATLHAT